jgi:hypothetical protein
MLDPDMFPFCHEFYVVEKSIEVVVTINGNGTPVRIDAMHNLKADRYCAHVYIEECGFLKSADPVEDFPWTHGNSAEQALRSALSFLRERCPTAAA